MKWALHVAQWVLGEAYTGFGWENRVNETT